MAALKPTASAALTANDLLSGAIVWWTGADWSREPSAARRACDRTAHEALLATGAQEEGAQRVVGAYLVALDPVSGTPIALRERQRLEGPSIALPRSAKG